jgi:hypothetical protein
MKINQKTRCAGNALLVTLIMAGIIGFALASYLTLVRSQHASIVRSQSWNTAIPIIEAGIEDAITHINYNGLTNLGVSGWILIDDYYTKTRAIEDSYYVVQISQDDPPEIFSRAYVPAPFNSAPAKLALLASIGLSVEKEVSQYTTRRVQVTTRPEGLWSRGMVAKGRIDLNGNRVRTDSFDSADPLHSTDGLYDPAKAKDNGDVATNSSLVDSLGVWNANIYGRVATGPGGRVRIGPQGKVGTAAWQADPNTTGIQPGRFSDDMNVYFRHIDPPYTNELPPLPGVYDGVFYNYVLGTTGNRYMMNELKMSGQEIMYVAKDSVLYVTGDIQLTGNARIIIDPNATLVLYAGGKTDIAGNGVVNRTGNALNFVYFGLETNTDLKLGGNADFVGVIYAPYADFDLVGGGTSTVFDFVGASVTSTVKMTGNFNFHYDENVGRTAWLRGYIIDSWREL